MQKFTLSICSVCALLVLCLSSCKDDDEPFVKPKLSVATETVTIGEGGGTAEVGIVLDKAAPTDITVEYSLGGTAVSPADYSIVGPKGKLYSRADSATIKITIVMTRLRSKNIDIEYGCNSTEWKLPTTMKRGNDNRGLFSGTNHNGSGHVVHQ